MNRCELAAWRPSTCSKTRVIHAMRAESHFHALDLVRD